MKRIILVLCLILTITICGCSQTSQKATEPVVVTEPSYVVDENRVATPIPAAEAFAGGSGTEQDPYRIETAEQLALLAKYVNEENKEFNKSYYVQTSDIVIMEMEHAELKTA